jgi:flagellar motor switch protein FliG
MTNIAGKELSGPQKVAILTVMLGPDKAAEILASAGLEQHKIERLAFEVARLGEIDKDVQLAVVQEFSEFRGLNRATAGGLRFAEEFLNLVVGPEMSAGIIRRVRPKHLSGPFSSLNEPGAKQLIEVLRDELPQVIAVVLRYLSRKRAGEVLSGLPEDTRTEVVMRLVTAGNPSTEALRRLETILKMKIADLGIREVEPEPGERDGARTLVEILNYTDIDVEQSIFEALTERDPALCEQVRNSMFVFEDLPKIEFRMLQIALRELDMGELAASLKGTSESIKSAVFNNLSENASETLKEEMDALGKMRRRDVMSAQQKIVTAIRGMISEGIISTRRDKEEAEEEMLG